jgi:hypothetical protein
VKEWNLDRTLNSLPRVGPWLLLALSTVLVGVCVRAEERSLWFRAQASLAAILTLLGLVAWNYWRSQGEKSAFPPEVASYQQTLRKLMLFVIMGIMAVLFNAIRHEHWMQGLVSRAVGFGILIAGSAFIVGVLFGFLFGFPGRYSTSRSSGSQAASQSSSDQSVASGRQSRSFLYNTNLEEISDWLTKVIPGASLVELNKLPPLIFKLSEYMAKAVEPQNGLNSTSIPYNAPVTTAILGYFSCCGLLYGYIYTKYEETETSQEPYDDAPAVDAVDRWLHQPPGPNDNQARVDMMNAIKAASTATKVRIFLQAENYRKASTEDVNERSLPIFQALVEADTQEVFHRNRSQYAFALMGRKKDPKNPDDDWRRALDLLHDAIRIRDQSRDPGWQEYEEARDACERHLNPNSKQP